VRDLERPPSLLSLYARAALRRGDGGGPGAPGVPGVALRLAGRVPDAERVAAYARLCGERFGPDLPPLFPHLLGFPLQLALLTDPAAPFPAMGLVHVANHVEVVRGIPLGAAVDVEVEMTPVRPHRKGRTVDLLARASLDGEVVWRSASTYLRRGGGSEEPAESAVEAVEPADGGLRLGAVWRLPGDLGRRYAAVSGDRNPIHLSAPTARVLGFPRAIAHGMWTAARCLAALEGRLAPPYAVDVDFRSPILLPGTVELHTAVGADRSRFEVRARGKDRTHLAGAVAPL
jgi:acyl dehydratase